MAAYLLTLQEMKLFNIMSIIRHNKTRKDFSRVREAELDIRRAKTYLLKWRVWHGDKH